jgi:hypothetical protein
MDARHVRVPDSKISGPLKFIEEQPDSFVPFHK